MDEPDGASIELVEKCAPSHFSPRREQRSAASTTRQLSYLPTNQQPKWRSFGEDVIESHFAHITQTNFITSRAEHRTSNNVHPTRNLIPLRAFQCPPFCAPPDARDPIVEKATPPCTVVPNVLLRALKVSLWKLRSSIFHHPRKWRPLELHSIVETWTLSRKIWISSRRGCRTATKAGAFDREHWSAFFQYLRETTFLPYVRENHANPHKKMNQVGNLPQSTCN